MTDTTRIALITGGSRGLGKSTVLNLAKKGISCIFTYHSAPEKAEEVLAEYQRIVQNSPTTSETQVNLTNAIPTAIALPLDTGNTASFDNFVISLQESLATMGAKKIDFLVNNAGISNHTPFSEVTEAELDLQYQVNFKGVFFLTQKLLPLIQDGGQIINVSSGVTRFVNPDSIAYATLKGAVEVMTRYLAHDLGKRQITVNTIAPGAVQTDFSGGVVRDNPAINAMVANMTALGRPGLPDDLGKMIANFLTQDNHWVNAQRIEVSGGMRL